MTDHNPKAVRYVLLAIVAVACILALAFGIRAGGAAPMPCDSYSTVVHAIGKVGEKQVFQGIVNSGNNLVLAFASPKTNSWTLIVAGNGRACILAIGTDYQGDRIFPDPT